MSMAMMVAMASRKRDSQGRYAEGNNGNYSRMEEGGSARMGGYDRMESEMRGGMENEMRRQRDSRGRYMGGYGRMEDNYSMNDPEMRRQRDSRGRYMEGEGGAEMAYRPWPEPHIPPYLDRPGMNDMRRMADEPDGQNPYGGQPEVYRKQERQSNGEMRRMADGKTSAGEINYNRPDGGYGNVSYFMHKTDPMNQHDGKEHFEQPRQIGFQSNEQKPLDKHKVMEWVEEMEDADGVKGGKYTWHQVQQYAMNMGITGQQRLMEMYWAMNAMYADYSKIAKKFGVDKPEFYACMAKAFLEDPDAVDNKVEEYVKYIVK